MFKICVEDVVLLDGAHVPVSAAICYNNYSLGRGQSIWGADALDLTGGVGTQHRQAGAEAIHVWSFA